jgi:hypothetical protein
MKKETHTHTYRIEKTCQEIIISKSLQVRNDIKKQMLSMRDINSLVYIC